MNDFGIYIHVPFCKKKCSYCDFYSITDYTIEDEYVDAAIKEISYFSEYLNKPIISTIYIGGGTPSSLKIKNLEKIVNSLFKKFKIQENFEFTIEVNPDDVNENFLKEIKQLRINRISIGIQSLNDKTLFFLKRRHNSLQALQALEKILKLDFSNLNVDIIYGIPNTKVQDVIDSLSKILDFNPTHISAYCLSYEKGTKIYRLLKRKKIIELDEEIIINQYFSICEFLRENNYIHYEVSNFSLKGYESRHNSRYWNGLFYIGIGPSAHSYLKRNVRCYNIKDINLYINNWKNNKPIIKFIKLTRKDIFNEYLITRLRTFYGINLKELKTIINEKKFYYWYSNLFEKKLPYFLKKGDYYYLSEKNWLILDFILRDLLL